jgi:hypothetical protein
VAAGGESHEVRIGAGLTVQESLEAGVVYLFGQSALEAPQRREAGVVLRDLLRVEGEGVQSCSKILRVQVGLARTEALRVVLNEHVEGCLAV